MMTREGFNENVLYGIDDGGSGDDGTGRASKEGWWSGNNNGGRISNERALYGTLNG